ncbi:hypothetical protein T492DRAFT_1133889 [Pavlovales sp. CCMP2436]|nr:hypothetical protein T492DRAFT_1133889 [Pavlovales sp. CCMP2436]
MSRGRWMVAALTARSPADLSRAETQLAETQLPEAPRDKFPFASRPFCAHRYRALLEREASLCDAPPMFTHARLSLIMVPGILCPLPRRLHSRETAPPTSCAMCAPLAAQAGRAYLPRRSVQRGRIRVARADGDAHGCLRSSSTHMGRGMPDAAVARRGSQQTQQSGMPGVAGAIPDALPDALPDAVSDALPYTLQGDGAIPYRSKPGGRSVFTVPSQRVAFRRFAGSQTATKMLDLSRLHDPVAFARWCLTDRSAAGYWLRRCKPRRG